VDAGDVDAGDVDAGAQLGDDVVIRRDIYGIPHIESETDEGVMYGLGYATAQDRLLQMNLMALGVQGRVSEFLGRVPMGGKDSVANDRKMRTFGYWRHAQAAADRLPAETRALLDAYADGVNQYLADFPAGENPLLTELGVTPQVWTAAHSIGVWYWLAGFFSGDGLKKADLLHQFEAEVANIGLNQAIEAKLCGNHPGDSSAGIVQQGDVSQQTQDAIAAYAQSVGHGSFTCSSSRVVPNVPPQFAHEAPKFSHAWVVGGANTTTGAAVLVSDPQTPVSFPSIWHEFVLSGETIKARGVGVPGNPGILVGWNENIAWGVTSAGYSQSDLFRIQMVGNRSDVYRLDGVDTTMMVAVETIEIAGEASQTIEYRETVFGPMVTEFVLNSGGEEFAARFIPFAENDTDTVVSFIDILKSEDLEDLNAALDNFRYPAVNMVAGDSAGNVMYRLLGAVPVRAKRSPLGGSIAQQGNSIDFQWQGSIPNEFMPQVINPAGGNVLSANHRATGDWYPLSIGFGTGGKGDTNRSARIRELLAQLPEKATPRQVFDLMQRDCVDVNRRDMVVMAIHLGSLGRLSSDARSTVAALATWSANGGQITVDSDNSFLAGKLTSKFRLATIGAEMFGNYGGGGNGYSLFGKTMRERLAADPNFVPTDEEIAFIDELMSKAWVTARNTPQANWAAGYADEGKVVLDYFSLLGMPELSSSTSDEIALQCHVSGTVWAQVSQSYTQWVDLANVDTSEAMMPPGNSELFASDSAQNQASHWAAGTLRAAPLSTEAFKDISESSLVLSRD
ncbi:MAG: penicillin acylase family protein, partial [Kofleriaceae bacterium]|nr:penicillin acylase family protein [Kofleriaceae bacterium]